MSGLPERLAREALHSKGSDATRDTDYVEIPLWRCVEIVADAIRTTLDEAAKVARSPLAPTEYARAYGEALAQRIEALK